MGHHVAIIVFFKCHFKNYVFGDLWRPDADFVSIVEDETAGTPVLEDGVVVLVLVELDTPVEPKHTHEYDTINQLS